MDHILASTYSPVTLLSLKHRLICHVVHYSDIIMCVMAFQITSLKFVYSAVYSGADQRKHQSSASLAFVRGIHQWPLNSLHKRPITRKMFPFDDVIMCLLLYRLLFVHMRLLIAVTHYRQWQWFCDPCHDVGLWVVSLTSMLVAAWWDHDIEMLS